MAMHFQRFSGWPTETLAQGHPYVGTDSRYLALLYPYPIGSDLIQPLGLFI